MIVFKNYLKVAKSFLPIIIVYTLIFVGIATISSTSGAQNTDAFEASESRIAFINHDQESSFINSFQKYIKENAEYVNIQDSDEELRDALFFRKVDYIMIIPKGFTDDF
ncbi:MAG: ABC transporter permease [Coprobacillus cateniformis]